MQQANKAKEKETILTICTALMVLFLWSKGKNIYLLQVAVVLGLIGMFSDFITTKIHWAWMKLANGMGWIMNKVILGVVFFFILFPVALLSRLFVKNNFTKNKTATTFYKECNHTYSKKDLENMW